MQDRRRLTASRKIYNAVCVAGCAVVFAVHNADESKRSLPLIVRFRKFNTPGVFARLVTFGAHFYEFENGRGLYGQIVFFHEQLGYTRVWHRRLLTAQFDDLFLVGNQP